MARAKDEREAAARGAGCLGKADDDEPVFILRGQDKLAPVLVRLWAELASQLGCPQEKVDEAEECASLMDCWLNRKWPD